MPAHTTARNLRGNALMDLDGQLDELILLAEDIQALERMISHIRRRVVNVSWLRIQSVGSLREASNIEMAA